MLGFEPVAKPVCGAGFDDANGVAHDCVRAAPYWTPWHIHVGRQVWFFRIALINRVYYWPLPRVGKKTREPGAEPAITTKQVSHPPTGGTCGNCRGRGATTAGSTGSPSSGIVHDQRVCPICGGSGKQTDSEYVAYLDREIGAAEADRFLETIGRHR